MLEFLGDFKGPEREAHDAILVSDIHAARVELDEGGATGVDDGDDGACLLFGAV